MVDSSGSLWKKDKVEYPPLEGKFGAETHHLEKEKGIHSWEGFDSEELVKDAYQDWQLLA